MREQRQRPHVAVGWRRIHHRVVGEQPAIDATFARQRDDKRSEVDGRDVEQVVEHRHPAEGGDPIPNLAARAVE